MGADQVRGIDWRVDYNEEWGGGDKGKQPQ